MLKVNGVGPTSGTVLKPVSEPARRLEIFTGAGRRRAWSADQKAAIVAGSLGGAASVSAVARRQGRKRYFEAGLRIFD